MSVKRVVSRYFVESCLTYYEICSNGWAPDFLERSIHNQIWNGLPSPQSQVRDGRNGGQLGHISSAPLVLARRDSYLYTLKTSYWATDFLLILLGSFTQFKNIF